MPSTLIARFSVLMIVMAALGGCTAVQPNAPQRAVAQPAFPQALTPQPTRIEVFEVSQLNQKSTPLSLAKPIYPLKTRSEGLVPEVVVEFTVDASGNVRNAFAARSTRQEFEVAAVEAVSKWKFTPGRKDGRAVACRMQVPVVFSLNEED